MCVIMRSLGDRRLKPTAIDNPGSARDWDTNEFPPSSIPSGVFSPPKPTFLGQKNYVWRD